MIKCRVFLPVYCGYRFLRKTLDSVLNQTYKEYEVIVIDDQSNDKTYEILQEYKEQYPEKLVVKQNKYNLGVGLTLFNMYNEYNNVDYIAMIGQDDIWNKDYLKEQIFRLELEKAVVSFGKVCCINEEGKRRSENIFHHDILNNEAREELFLKLVRNNFLCAPASVICLKELNKLQVGTFWGYNNDRSQDYELWLNLILKGNFIYNKSAICFYRIHGNSLSNSSRLVIQGKLEKYSMLRRVLESKAFIDFIQDRKNKEEFISSLINALETNQEYCNLSRLLIMDLCEKLCNYGYKFKVLTNKLNEIYMRNGVISKCLHNGQVLPEKILCLACGKKTKEKVKEIFRDSKNFDIIDDFERINTNIFCIVDCIELDKMLLKEEFVKNLQKNRVAILGYSLQVEQIKEEYCDLLVLTESDLNEDLKLIEKKIISYIEDFTTLYSEGYLFLEKKQVENSVPLYQELEIKNCLLEEKYNKILQEYRRIKMSKAYRFFYKTIECFEKIKKK